MSITGRYDFVIDGMTHCLIFQIPVNRPFKKPSGVRLIKIHQLLHGVKIMTIEKVSRIGQNIIYSVDQRL